MSLDTPQVSASKVVTQCLHCALDIPRSRRARGSSFCCGGCEQVYQLIHEQGLDGYYDLKWCATSPVPEARESAFLWLDAAIAEALRESGRAAGGAVDLPLEVQGVHCAACVWLLERLFERTEGGVALQVNAAQGTVDLTWDMSRGDLREYLRSAESFGYRFAPLGDSRASRGRVSRSLLVRFGIAAAATMNVMIFSICYYLGLDASAGAVYELIGHASLLLSALTVAVGGGVFYKTTLVSARRGLVHFDLPIALGMTLAFAGSAYAHFRFGAEAAYFDSVCAFVTLMLLGRFLQERALERSRATLLSESGSDLFYARRFREGSLETVRAEDLQEGDELLVAPGEWVPAPGRLAGAEAVTSRGWLTGESVPLSVANGEDVAAGSINAGASPMRVVVTAPAQTSRLHQLLARGETRRNAGDDADRVGNGKASEVSDPSTSDPSTSDPSTRFWDRLARVYVAAVLLAALAGFAGWSLLAAEGWEKGLRVAVSVLVVTCPCAFGLAVPLARELARLRLRASGVFLRRQGVLDRALSIRKIVFDKTGTLTKGRIRLDTSSLQTLRSLDADHRRVLYDLVSSSQHPVSRALEQTLVELPDDEGWARRAAADEVREERGAGLEWRHHTGLYRLGRVSFALDPAVLSFGVPLAATATSSTSSTSSTSDDPQTSESLDAEDQPASVVFSLNGRALAIFRLVEELKDDARTEASALREMGYQLYLFTGDLLARARRVSRELGFSDDAVEAELTPEGKLAALRALDDRDTVMIGDGLNDASSLEAAWISGTPAVDLPAVPARCDFFFFGEGVSAVRDVLSVAQRLRSVVRLDLIIAVGYNVVALALALAGVIDPLVAALLMPASSIGLVLFTRHRMAKESTWTSS